MDRRFWVGFNLVKGIGAVRLRALLSYFGSLEEAWNATPAQWQEAGLSPRLAEAIARVRATVNLDRLWEQIEQQGITVLTWEDEAYPTHLKQIEQPPPLLYLRGHLTLDDQFAVAIVGTRRITPYGRQVTEELASSLAMHGVTVVSGLARGVDAVAHAAALKAGGRTLAVLGSGVDKIYPPEHLSLAEKIMAQGALISDYPPSTPPEAVNFPPRNRIISGLSMAVVVVEAGETSGALITAAFAAEQGREVFAVPGSIYAPQSKGTNKLIQNGAHPLLSPQDLIQTLELTRTRDYTAARKALPSDTLEAQLLEALGPEPRHVDELGRHLGLPIEKVSATLIIMEIKGLVRQVGSLHYVAVREEQANYFTG